jgi:hypothetical protein
MALRDWVVATATLATPATLAGEMQPVATVAVASRANDEACYRWRVIGSRCGVYEVCCLPELTAAEVRELYPGATVEPLPDEAAPDTRHEHAQSV